MDTGICSVRLLGISLITLVIISGFSKVIFSQTQIDYRMTLTNGVKVNDHLIEFDVLLKAQNTSFTLSSYQCSFLFNSQVTNSGELSFSYIEGTSDLTNLPSYAIGVNNNDGLPKLTFASMAGSDVISVNEIKVGRFRLNNSTPFTAIDPQIRWNFEGFVSTIITGQNFQNITAPANHLANIALELTSTDLSLPSEFNLFQNYPNPFNPSTSISFSLPIGNHVKLEVFDILGQKVEEIANGFFDAGTHKVQFNGVNLPSGTYICKLEVKDKYSELIKMVLVK